MEKRQAQDSHQPAARAGGLFGGSRGQEASSQRPSWPFQVKPAKPSKRSLDDREGPVFKS